MNSALRFTALILLFTLSLPSMAASWEGKGKKLFENDKYQDVIELVEEYRKDREHRIALMLMAFSHLQLYEFNDTKTDKKAFKRYYELLEDKVDAQDLEDILYFIRQTDKPEVVEEARDLLKVAFGNVKKMNEVSILLPFTRVEDEKTRELAFNTLEEIMAVKRKYVEEGGTLRERDITIMSDEKLIRALLENVLISDAYGSLEYIEAPVLDYISDYEGDKIGKLEGAIKKSITKRLKEFPDSSWFSANPNIKPVTYSAVVATAPAWVTKATGLFERHQYEAAIELAAQHKRDKESRIGLMLLAFSHTQLYAFNDDKADQKAAGNYFDLLEDRVDSEDLENIYYFAQQSDKPWVIEEARDLLKRAFKNVKDISEAPRIYPFAKVEDEKTRELALAALEKIISLKRKYVEKGGTLRDKDITVMQDGGLIRVLLNNIDESDAFNALLDIEAPVLTYLSEFEDTKQLIKLEEKINKAIAKREKKYPESSWYSATGKTKASAK